MRSMIAIILIASSISRISAADERTAAAQQALAQSLGDKVQKFEMWTDDDGNVTGLIFINHQALTETAGQKPGIADADLAQLIYFPKLSAVNIEAQPLSDKGLSILKQFPNLKQVGFHYMGKAENAAASPDFITVIDGLRELEILEIKHNFRMDAINVHKLHGPFPKVWRLVLDTPLTAEQTMHLIELCPNVSDLQLHRTSLSGEQLERVATLLPELEVLWFKPRGPLKAEHLQALKDFRKLKIFSPQHFKNNVPYAGGWEVLESLPALERLEIAGQAATANKDELKQLEQKRLNLVIDSKLTRSRNYRGL